MATSSPIVQCVCGFQKQAQKIQIKAVAPKDLKRDWIGPPDPASNIRPIKFFIPKDETERERNYREQRQKIGEWNQKFWENHNEHFSKSKEEFIKTELSKKKAVEKPSDVDDVQILTAHDMSVFYRQFLNANYKKHIKYNMEWYKKNISLLWPALLINIAKLFKKHSP